MNRRSFLGSLALAVTTPWWKGLGASAKPLVSNVVGVAEPLSLAKMQLYFNGVPVMEDPLCPPNMMYFVSKSAALAAADFPDSRSGGASAT